MELDYNSIGIRIKRYRKEKGLTQLALAELSNLEPSNISHIERGATKLSLPTIVKIANALEVSVDDLLCDSISNSFGSYLKTADEILSDCTHTELKIITDMMITLKNTLRKNNI